MSTRKIRYRAHALSVHQDDCEQCSFMSTKKIRCKTHVESVHQDDCELCSRMSANKIRYKAHVSVLSVKKIGPFWFYFL